MVLQKTKQLISWLNAVCYCSTVAFGLQIELIDKTLKMQMCCHSRNRQFFRFVDRPNRGAFETHPDATLFLAHEICLVWHAICAGLRASLSNENDRSGKKETQVTRARHATNSISRKTRWRLRDVSSFISLSSVTHITTPNFLSELDRFQQSNGLA